MSFFLRQSGGFLFKLRYYYNMRMRVIRCSARAGGSKVVKIFRKCPKCHETKTNDVA
jgi:hypothetical protein